MTGDSIATTGTIQTRIAELTRILSELKDEIEQMHRLALRPQQGRLYKDQVLSKWVESEKELISRLLGKLSNAPTEATHIVVRVIAMQEKRLWKKIKRDYLYNSCFIPVHIHQDDGELMLRAFHEMNDSLARLDSSPKESVVQCIRQYEKCLDECLQKPHFGELGLPTKVPADVLCDESYVEQAKQAIKKVTGG